MRARPRALCGCKTLSCLLLGFCTYFVVMARYSFSAQRMRCSCWARSTAPPIPPPPLPGLPAATTSCPRACPPSCRPSRASAPTPTSPTPRWACCMQGRECTGRGAQAHPAHAVADRAGHAAVPPCERRACCALGHVRTMEQWPHCGPCSPHTCAPRAGGLGKAPVCRLRHASPCCATPPPCAQALLHICSSWGVAPHEVVMVRMGEAP